MSGEEVSIALWHEKEKVWWDTYGEYMTYQWQLTPWLNRIVRSAWQRDYIEFLCRPQGSLLDVGCGGGWLSLEFARRGMTVHGIDVSHEQIEMANRLKQSSGCDRLSFECADLSTWNDEAYGERFDSIFVNAFLHHLPPAEIGLFFGKMEHVLKKGGHCYLYEPLFGNGDRKKAAFVRGIDRFVERLVALTVHRLPASFGLWSSRHRLELERGYTPQSPQESPIDVGSLKSILPGSLSIREIQGWHLYSLGFCMQLMSLDRRLRALFTPMALLLHGIDRLFLSRIPWESFARQGRFIMCSVKLTKS